MEKNNEKFNKYNIKKYKTKRQKRNKKRYYFIKNILSHSILFFSSNNDRDKCIFNNKAFRTWAELCFYKHIISNEFSITVCQMIVYGILTNAGIMFYTYMIIILLILPIIPIMITSLIISVIMRFTNKIKNKNKAMYIII